MPAILANSRSFRLSSDYPLDKIVWMYTGSVTLAANGNKDVVLPHSLPFTPLPTGTWTTASDWSVSYEINSGPLGGNPFTVNTSVEANATNVTFANQNNVNSPVTLYFRIYCLEPSDVNLDAPSTNMGVDNFMLNSGLNYTKLFLAGVTTATTASGTYTPVVIHNLGYKPQVMAWVEELGIARPLAFSQPVSGNSISVSSVSLGIRYIAYGTNPMRVHYRVYVDE